MTPSFIDFKLEETDQPYLIKLAVWSERQHNLLLASARNPRPSYTDLSIEFAVPLGTVKSRLNRARQRITKWRKEQASQPHSSTGQSTGF